jgi:DNA-directed RNA polymerase subunit F
MSQPRIIEEETITLSELNDNLAVIQERDGELSFRAGKSMDHLNHLNLVDGKAREEIFKKIEALNVPRLKPLHIAKIIDLMPKSVKELNLVLSGYTLTVNKEYQQQIIEAITG